MKQRLFKRARLNYSELNFFIRFYKRAEFHKLRKLYKRMKHQEAVINRSYRNVNEYHDIVSFIENVQETKYLRKPVENFLAALKKDSQKIEDSMEEREQKKFILEQKLQNV